MCVIFWWTKDFRKWKGRGILDWGYFVVLVR